MQQQLIVHRYKPISKTECRQGVWAPCDRESLQIAGRQQAEPVFGFIGYGDFV
jgi:hypothetical protein